MKTEFTIQIQHASKAVLRKLHTDKEKNFRKNDFLCDSYPLKKIMFYENTPVWIASFIFFFRKFLFTEQNVNSFLIY